MAEQQNTPPKDNKPQQSTQLVALNSVKALLEASRSAVASRLPRHLTADRMLKVALTSINKTPKLLECTRESLMAAVMQAAELGLEPGGALGEGYLVPYNNKIKGPGGTDKWVMQCQFIPGYRGLIALARRSGDISNLYAEAVYKGDKFDVELGLDPKMVHKPDYDDESRDDAKNLTFTYAVARFKDGSFQFVVLSRKQIERLRERSKASGSGPWVTDFEEMAKKTAIRRLSKYLPLSVELARALDLQAGAEAGDFTTIEGASFELDAGAETRALVEGATSGTEGAKAVAQGKAKDAAKKAAGKTTEPSGENPRSGDTPSGTATDTSSTETSTPSPSTSQSEEQTTGQTDPPEQKDTLFEQQATQERKPPPPAIDPKGW